VTQVVDALSSAFTAAAPASFLTGAVRPTAGGGVPTQLRGAITATGLTGGQNPLSSQTQRQLLSLQEFAQSPQSSLFSLNGGTGQVLRQFDPLRAEAESALGDRPAAVAEQDAALTNPTAGEDLSQAVLPFQALGATGAFNQIVINRDFFGLGADGAIPGPPQNASARASLTDINLFARAATGTVLDVTL